MSSAIPNSMAAPIRQPRGPSSNSFGNAELSAGPPEADADSLRRSNTFSTGRHQPSASVSSTPAATRAFHGARYAGNGRFRAGSITASVDQGGLVRKGSTREVHAEEVLIEGGEEGTTETASWGKGLSRQSSLPSRRGIAVVMPSTDMMNSMAPPLRPPRRIQNEHTSPSPSTHIASQSLSSLAVFAQPVEDEARSSSVSRTQSLREQARNAENSGLGRSASLRSSGEVGASGQTEPTHKQHSRSHSLVTSSPGQSTISRDLYTPPTPPPVSASEASPPFTKADNKEGADLKRHQSLQQGYGTNNKVRERLERSQGLLSLEQHEDLRRREAKRIQKGSDTLADGPMSPIGHNVWSMSHTGDDGWNRPQQMQDAFEAMSLGRRAIGFDSFADPRSVRESSVISSSSVHEEPSWVANLVGHPDGISPQVNRIAPPQDPYRTQNQHRWPDPPFNGYLQQQQLMPQYPNKAPYQYPNYPYQAMYTPPATATFSNQDLEVVELAKSKGLNPAAFNCRPSVARFFVIKSYTEEDVQKSLKHEIWSSTVLGNKRLDAAFRESSDQLPIFLFFSVNGSRHFCGVAQMLTPVDESQSSNVWAQDKWKGIFKVKWIFVRDVPTSALRHIRLLNTPEQKPITNSRDTQELHYEAGCEVLQIFLDHQNKSKTSLLQDFAYYEALSQNRVPPRMSMTLPPAPQTVPMPHMANSMGMPISTIPPVPHLPARFR